MYVVCLQTYAKLFRREPGQKDPSITSEQRRSDTRLVQYSSHSFKCVTSHHETGRQFVTVNTSKKTRSPVSHTWLENELEMRRTPYQ
jgi:hypothetical protein